MSLQEEWDRLAQEWGNIVGFSPFNSPALWDQRERVLRELREVARKMKAATD